MTKLYDLTQTNIVNEFCLICDGNVLADSTFRRQVHRVTTDEERTAQTDRLLKARRATC